MKPAPAEPVEACGEVQDAGALDRQIRGNSFTAVWMEPVAQRSRCTWYATREPGDSP